MKCVCDYSSCDSVVDISEMVIFTDWCEVEWHACPKCADKVNDSTGYCGMSCMFGYGCDQSC